VYSCWSVTKNAVFLQPFPDLDVGISCRVSEIVPAEGTNMSNTREHGHTYRRYTSFSRLLAVHSAYVPVAAPSSHHLNKALPTISPAGGQSLSVNMSITSLSPIVRPSSSTCTSWLNNWATVCASGRLPQQNRGSPPACLRPYVKIKVFDCAWFVLWETRFEFLPQPLHHCKQLEFVVVSCKDTIK